MHFTIWKNCGWLGGCLAMFTLGACSDSSDEIRDGWRATQRIVDMGVEQVQVQPRSAEPGGQSLDVSASVDCPSGGTARLDASFDAGGVMDLSLAFSSCKAEGVVIDGSLGFHMKWMTSETESSFEMRYQGSLEWSGSVSMTCDIELNAGVTTSVDLETYAATTTVTIEGHVCGEPADAILGEEDFT